MNDKNSPRNAIITAVLAAGAVLAFIVAMLTARPAHASPTCHLNSEEVESIAQIVADKILAEPKPDLCTPCPPCPDPGPVCNAPTAFRQCVLKNGVEKCSRTYLKAQ